MTLVLCPSEERLTALPSATKAIPIKYQSIWVLIGFTFWFGFYLGAVFMHAVSK